VGLVEFLRVGKLKVVSMGDKHLLTWGFHELAWSRRTSGFPLFLLDKDGNVLYRFYSTKKSGYRILTGKERYLVRYYRTNSGRVELTVYEIPQKGELKKIDTIVSVEGVLSLNVPEGVKQFLLSLLPPE